MLERLTADVKNFLDITWEDPATDKKAAGWTRAGITYLNGKAGQELEYPFGGDDWTLLMEYARYARDAALDVFENNYRSLILALQNDRKIERMNDEESAVSTGQ